MLNNIKTCYCFHEFLKQVHYLMQITGKNDHYLPYYLIKPQKKPF